MSGDDDGIFMQDGNKIVWTNQTAHAQLWNDLKLRYFFDYPLVVLRVVYNC